MSESPTTSEAVPATGSAEGVPVASPSGNPPGSEALGDAGKRALDAMKTSWHAERDKRKELETRIAELEQRSTAPDPRADKRIIRAELKAAAAGKFHDISDVFANIDTSAFEVNEEGDVDADKLNAAITDLLTRKPHLAASKRPRFEGTVESGPVVGGAGPSQLTRADLKGKSPEWIAKAKAEGRLNALLNIK